MSTAPDKETSSQELPLVSHLVELRDRLLRMVAVVIVVFVPLFIFADDLYTAIADPLRDALPEGSSMISTKPVDPFLIPFKLSLQLAIFLSVPYILYQFWAFVAPGLYKHEKRLVIPLLVSSTLLFYLGMAFAFYVVFPLVFTFLAGTAPDGIEVATDMGSYLDFVMTLFFAFGIAFEVPIATIILVWMGITTPEKLREKRPFVVVGTFVVGMLLTPPDVISQTLLALPMMVLFELGVFFSKGFMRQPGESREPEEPAVAAAASSGAAPAATPDASETPVGSDIDPATDYTDPDRYVPLSDDDMDAELDAIEEAEAEEEEDPHPPPGDPTEVAQKLERIQELRREGMVSEARDLLYEVLEQGDADQRMVARNILAQLDED